MNVPDTKRKIFDATLSCFIRKGYAGTTMDDVKNEAGISKGALYWHFKSKEDLIMELFRFWMESFSDDFAEAMEEDVTPREKIHVLISRVIKHWSRDLDSFRTLFEFINIGMKNDSFRLMIDEFYQAWSAEFSAMLAEGIRLGQFNINDPDKHTIAIMALLDGFGMRLMLDPSLANDDQINYLSQFIDWSLNYTGPSEQDS